MATQLIYLQGKYISIHISYFTDFEKNPFQAWQTLLDLTTESLDLASSYWSLRGEDVYQHPSDWQGEWIFRELVKGKIRFY